MENEIEIDPKLSLKDYQEFQVNHFDGIREISLDGLFPWVKVSHDSN